MGGWVDGWMGGWVDGWMGGGVELGLGLGFKGPSLASAHGHGPPRLVPRGENLLIHLLDHLRAHAHTQSVKPHSTTLKVYAPIRRIRRFLS
eukprot:8747579-Pyramimonas_sp.AAC.1